MGSPQTEALGRRAGEQVPPDREASGAGLVMAGVVKRWPRQKGPVLDHVDLELPPGTTTSIVGANGAGKTTLLRIVSGVIKADGGTICLDGLDSEREGREYRRRTGFLAAGNTGLFGRLPVRQHLEYWARLSLLPSDRGAAAVAQMLDTFGLRELAGRRVDRLSLGQRQRVRAALTFLHAPDLLLLDEPYTSLDAEGVELLGAVLRGFIGRGGTALWCSPAGMQEQWAFDRHYVLADGQLSPG